MERQLLTPAVSDVASNPPMPSFEQHRSHHRGLMLDAFLDRQRTAAPGQSRRQSARAFAALPITLGMGEWETDTRTREFSPGGCSFMMSRDPGQTEMRVALELQPGAVLRCRARIVGLVRRADGFQVCVSFIGLNDAQRDALAELVLATLLAQTKS